MQIFIIYGKVKQLPKLAKQLVQSPFDKLHPPSEEQFGQSTRYKDKYTLIL